MAATPLIVGADERAALNALRDKAAAAPLDMQAVLRDIQTPDGMKRHMERMKAFTIPIPMAYDVTFSIETGHPGGTMRHMSMSVAKKGRAPVPEAIWMVAQELGFVGGLETCMTYPEEFGNGGVAINVIQPVRVMEAATA